LSGTAASSVPRLFERLIALTERLVPHAPPDEQGRLFLCRIRKRRHRAGLTGNHALNEALRKLIRRWDVRDASGRLLSLNLAMLRPAGLTLLYRQRRDLIGVSRAAGHSSLAVTVRYVLDPETERMNDLFIAHRQTGVGAPEPLALAARRRDARCGSVLAGGGICLCRPHAGTLAASATWRTLPRVVVAANRSRTRHSK